MTLPVPLWRKIQRENFTSIEKLSAYLELDLHQKQQILQSKKFPLNLPLRLAAKIEKGNLSDPLFRQFVPLQEESLENPGFLLDPVGDCDAQKTPRFLQKYVGRVLLVTTSACAMHCRYCFRQNFTYPETKQSYTEELRLIREDPSIHEVILSGGDPLSLSNAHLKELMDQISGISHVKRIRFHSRFPIGIPERIDEDLLALFAVCRPQLWFVIHCNHPRELDEDVIAALKKIQKLGIPILNQAVLLKGVNDSLETLQALCEKCIDQGISPYYLHQLDKVQGAAHFEVPIEKGQDLIEALTKRLAGYGIPKYVREIAGEPSKTSL